MNASTEQIKPRKTKKQERHDALRKRFHELMSLRVEGMQPRSNDVVEKLAAEFFYSVRTVKDILWKS